MRSLAGIRGRLDELLSARAVENERPSTVILLPRCGREPDSDAPWPRCTRAGKALVVVYRIEDGQPTDEQIKRLLDESVRS